MTADRSPTSRALLALELVQNAPGITAERLARRLDVTERAARRYVAVLREAGIPIEAERGPYGGYRVGRGVRLPPLMFSSTEALGLVMAVLDGHHDAGDPDDPVGSAMGKILRALPESVASQAEVVRRTAAPAPDRAAARPRPDVTAALVQACAEHRHVHFEYHPEGGSQWRTRVEPWAVVVRHGRWYLLCRSVARGVQRAYRVDRISDVEESTETFEPPRKIDPVAELEAHLAEGWDHETEVVIEASFDEAGRWTPRSLGRLEPLDEQRCRLVGSTSNPAWFVAQLVDLPASYRIVGSAEVRETARLLGERLRQAGAHVSTAP